MTGTFQVLHAMQYYASLFHGTSYHLQTLGDTLVKVANDLQEEPEARPTKDPTLPWIRSDRWQIPILATFCELSRTLLSRFNINPDRLTIGLTAASLTGALLTTLHYESFTPTWTLLLLTTSTAIPASAIFINVLMKKTPSMLDAQISGLFSQTSQAIPLKTLDTNIPAAVVMEGLHVLYRTHQGIHIGTHFLRLPKGPLDAVIDGNRCLFKIGTEALTEKVEHLVETTRRANNKTIAAHHHHKLGKLLHPKVALTHFKQKLVKLL